MHLLFFDLETNGTDPYKDSIVEAAGVLWSIPHRSMVGAFSWLVKAEHNNAERINGIPEDLVTTEGVRVDVLRDRLATWFMRSETVVAHNAAFDRSFTEQIGMPSFGMPPWLCTQDDFDWPRASKSNGLVDIMLTHGLGVVQAHRALTDAMGIARLFERCAEMGHPPEELLRLARRPKRRYRAHVTFRTNQLAKENGFRWSPDDKMWWRKIAPEDVAELSLPFEVSEVGP